MLKNVKCEHRCCKKEETFSRAASFWCMFLLPPLRCCTLIGWLLEDYISCYTEPERGSGAVSQDSQLSAIYTHGLNVTEQQEKKKWPSVCNEPSAVPRRCHGGSTLPHLLTLTRSCSSFRQTSARSRCFSSVFTLLKQLCMIHTSN